MNRKIHHFLMIVLLLLLYSCKKDTSISTCEISEQAQNHYLYDAASLAVEYMYENSIADTAEIEIPDQYLTPFLKALGMLYDMPDIPYYDSLILVHRYLNETYGAVFIYNQQEPWIVNWLNGNVPTGNQTADALIQQYNLTVQGSNFSNYLIVKSNRPLNTRSLISEFQQLSGIEHGSPNTYIHFFSKLEGNIQGNNVYLRFYLGYGDCFAGCFGYNYWDYLVNIETCSAQYLGMNL